jgi:predicted exporter
VAAVFVLIVLLGGVRVQVNDDVRLLQSSSPELLAEQRRVMRLTGIANPAQFLLVEADTPEAVLQAEEAVRTSLDLVRARGLIDGYQAVSQWVPSVARQREDATILDRRVYAPGGWLERLAGRLGQPASWVEASRIARRAAFANTLRVEAWLDSPVSEPFRHHWLGRSEHGFASVILFQGIHGQEGVNALRGVAQHSAGAVWVDRVESASALLGVFRREITVVLGVGYLLVLATLIVRYGRAAWSVLAPTAMASLSAVALFGWLGLTVNLFTVLALLLVLGMGIDYSIYLHEERRDPARAWLGVSLSAMSTLLSFGLLAFSRTPALEIFGFTMLCGVGLAWLLAPSIN